MTYHLTSKPFVSLIPQPVQINRKRRWTERLQCKYEVLTIDCFARDSKVTEQFGEHMRAFPRIENGILRH
jgi:hypothetical protein